MALSYVTDVDAAGVGDLIRDHPRCGQQFGSLPFEISEQPVEVFPVEVVQPGIVGLNKIECQGGDQEPQSRGDPGGWGEDQRGAAGQFRNAVSVHRPRPSEGGQRERPGTLAPLHDMHAGGVGHVLIHQLVDAPCRLGHRQPHRSGDPGLDGPAGRFGVEFHAAAQEVVRIEVSEDQVGIGDGRLGPAQAVADRARVRPGRLRSDLEQPELVDPGYRTSPRPDLDHLDHRHLHRQTRALPEPVPPVDLEVVSDRRTPVRNDAQLGGGAPHVEGEQVVHPGVRTEGCRRQCAGGRARFQQPDREPGGGVHGGDTPRRQHHEEGSLESQIGKPALQSRQILLGEGLDVHVGDGGGGAFVLTYLGSDLRGDRDSHPGSSAVHRPTSGPLIGGIGEAVKKTDRHRFDPPLGQLGGKGLHVLLVHFPKHLAPRRHPLGNVEPKMSRGKGDGHLQEQVVELVTVLPPDLHRVPETLGGQQRGAGALALDDGVGHQSGPVHQMPDVRWVKI